MRNLWGVRASMKVPPKRKGNSAQAILYPPGSCLNESPSEKEGKLLCPLSWLVCRLASMKVPPKRKGNTSRGGSIVSFPASMKVPPKRKGNTSLQAVCNLRGHGLNESPSEKEGKWRSREPTRRGGTASMKVPPKRKGNAHHSRPARSSNRWSLNESPSEKEGKCRAISRICSVMSGLNESPSEKEGKSGKLVHSLHLFSCLNESPSEKEGKWLAGFLPLTLTRWASMKVPPKRKGNFGVSRPSTLHI